MQFFRKTMYKRLTPFLIGMICFSCQMEKADLVIKNARVITVEDTQPQAEAIAVKGDRIIDVGSSQTISRYIGSSTEVLDLDGQTVIPGFIESHAHFMGLGYAKLNLDLTQTRNYQDLIDSVAAAVAISNPGEWIIGRGWHQERWDPAPSPMVKGYPYHQALSRISTENPVYLTHASGHAVLVNRKAMDIAGISRFSKDPAGGTIIKTRALSPTGILLETAANLVAVKMADYEDQTLSEKRQKKAFQLAVKACLKNGITTFHDAGVSFSNLNFFKEMLSEGELKIRLWVMINESNQMLEQKIADYRWIGLGNHHLTVRSIKRFIDGALGAHGAWLLEPYLDMPGSHGLVLTPVAELEKTAQLAAKHGFQMCTHAIGDRGNREILDIYQKIYENNPDQKDLRWRVEHAQHLSIKDIPRFAELGIIAAMQTNHCTSDGPWVPKRIGKQRSEEGAYVWQKLINSGAVIANGTDAPVEEINPLKNYFSAITREMANGETFTPSQCMSRMEALESYTINGAFAGFEENIKGSIATGKLADLTVLSGDILTISEDKIPKTKVLYTIVGGKVLYRANDN